MRFGAGGMTDEAAQAAVRARRWKLLCQLLAALGSFAVHAQPAAPVGLTATPGDAGAVLEWSDPSDAGIVGYELRLGTGSPPAFNSFTTVIGSGPTTTTAPVAGLTNGTRYAFEVRAVNAVGPGPAARTSAALAASPSAAVTFADPVLRGAIERRLGKRAGETITQGDMAKMPGLYARDVSSLSGLEHAVNMTILLANRGTVSDLSPLSGVTALTSLALDDHSIADLSPLAGHTALAYLNVSNNLLSDIAPLSGLTALESLLLFSNSISDISPAAGLTALTLLGLDNNAIADISPLVGNAGLGAGDYLYLRGNPLDGASVRTHIPALQARGVHVAFDADSSPPPPPQAALLPDRALREAVARAVDKDPDAVTAEDLLALRHLNAASAGVADLTGLRAAANLEELELGGNALTDVGELAALSQLTLLDLSDNALADLAPLSELTGLRVLLLAGNRIADLRPVEGLTELRELTLDGNARADLSQLAGARSLQRLNLERNRVIDLAPLSMLTSLRGLLLADNRVANLQPLGGLPELRELSLEGNAVEDVSPLAGARSLRRLNLERNRVIDLAPLRHLDDLTRLRLASNRVADISPLLDNAGLGAGDVVGLRGNPLSAASIDGVGMLRARGVSVLAGLPVPLFAAGRAALKPHSFVRLVNHSDAAGDALVWGVDDAGHRFGPARLAIGAGRTAHFNSHDLEVGNAAKKLREGLGVPTAGDWRLEILSSLDLQAMALLRQPNGPPAAVHDTLRRFGEVLRVPLLPAARDQRTAGSLRLVNPTNVDETVLAWGVDDAGRGRLATGIVVPAKRAVTVTAAALEAPRIGAVGRGLGRGEGQWRLELHAPWPLQAQALATGVAGHVGNLSAAGASSMGGVLRVPLFPPKWAPGRRGVARVTNLGAVAGTVHIEAVDDAGARAGPVALELEPFATAEFDSRALEEGDAHGALAAGVGSPTRGAWRLELRSTLNIRAYAYAQSDDGYVTSLLDTAPAAGGQTQVAMFNPGSNRALRGSLRLVNDGGVATVATITSVDDAGAPGGPVRVAVPAGESLRLAAADLEAGGAGFNGALGDGHGKWRLRVASDAPLTVMSLIEDAEGRLSNVSTRGW